MGRFLFYVIFIPLLIIVSAVDSYAQSGLCDPTVPFYNVNLSGQPSGTWTSAPPIQRKGNCCGTTSPDRCIEFQITLDPTAVAINFNIASGAVPSGAMYYQVGCGPPTQVGQPICLNGPGPFTLTFCKPGNNLNTYSITSIPGPFVSPNDTTSQGCKATASAFGLIAASTTWTTIAPGSIGQYNNFLSCISGCTNVDVTPTGTSYPPYIDIKVCGTPIANACLGSISFCDTVRIYFNPPLVNTINPNPAAYCSSSGGINLTGIINGGVPPYTIKWMNSLGATVGSGLTYYATAPDTYTFYVEDANTPTCPARTTTVVVTKDILPIVNAGPDQSICGTNAIQLNGTVQNTSTTQWTGGTGSFNPDRNTLNATYTPSAIEITNGSVTLTLSSANSNSCPPVSDQITITLKPQLTISINGPSVLCYGHNYNLTTNTSGGTAPYSYLWNTGQTTSSLTNITAGNYTVTVTDNTPSTSCSATATLNIIQNPPIYVTVIPDALVSCNTTINITANATGGSGGFSYLWGNGSTSSIINVYSGTYSVTATDAQGCTAQASTSVLAPNSTLTSSIAGISKVCFNATTQLTAIGTGGFGSYTYSWSNGSTSNTINVGAGNYCVNITDGNGCISTSCITVTQTPPVNVSINAPSLICPGSTATLIANATGGTFPYSYLWNNGTMSSSINQNAGTYSVIATDALGCTGTAIVTLTEEPPMSITMLGQNATCFGQSSGSANAVVTGGTAPYNYQWSYLGSSNQSINNIPAGSYSVNVTDALGCVKTGTVTINQPNPLFLTTSSTNTSCYGGSDGSASVLVSGGTSPYQYLWSNGQATTNVNGLSNGNYSISVIDANGCSGSSSVIIAQPSQLSSSISVIAAITCNGSTDGSLGVSVLGGTPPYTYSWSTTPIQTTINAINLGAGVYSVDIRDSKNCLTTNSYVLNNPPVLNVVISSTTNVNCFGGATGSATVSVSGGQAPYSYSWSGIGSGGATITGLVAGNYTVTATDARGCSQIANFTITQPIAALQVNTGGNQFIACTNSTTITATVNGGTPAYTYNWNNGANTSSIAVSASGNYTVTVTDNNGCSANSSVNISLLASTLAVSINSPVYLCAGQTATLSAVTTGGNGAINYLWNNAAITPSIVVGVGNYCVQATDQDGCVVTACKNMVEEPPLIVQNSFSKSCPISTATVAANVSGGTTPYTYLWNTGETTPSITKLQGTYSYTVTDNNGCTKNGIGKITETTPMTVHLNNLQNVSCFGGNDATINVYILGGTSPYSYVWSPINSSSNIVYNLSSGSYSVAVTDSLGCATNKTYIITEPTQALNLTTTPVNVSCFGLSNGSINTSISGGLAPYSYLWSNGITSSSQSGLSIGNYSVWVTDTNGCLKTATVSITQPAILDINTVNTSNALCKNTTDGTATFTSTGGTRPITYAWSNGVTDSTSNTLGAGTYTVRITDPKGCKDSLIFSIAEPSALSYTSAINSAVCTNSNGKIELSTIGGGTSGYTVTWYDGSIGTTHTGLLPGNYYFTIEDAHNCKLRDTLTVSHQTINLNVSLTKTNIQCKEQNSGSIAASVSNGAIPFTYNWSNGSQTPGINSLQPGHYTLVVNDVNGCIGKDSTDVVIQYFVDITTSQPNLICYKDNVQLSATGAINYSWYNNTNTLLGNSPQITVIPTNSQSYTVIGYNNVCKDTAVININVQPKPAVSAGVDTSHCKGNFTQLNATGAITYSWSPSTGLNNTATASPIANNTSTQQYIVAGTDANGCKNTDTITVISYPLPIIFLTYQDSICKGNSSTFTAGGATTYSWSPTSNLTNTTGNITHASPSTNTNYTLIATDINGCSNDSVFTLHITQPPPINISGNNPICKNDSIFVTASGVATNYTWSPTTNISNPNASSTYIYPSSSMYYYITGTTTNNCSSYDSIYVTILPSPVLSSGGNYSMCAGGNIQLSASGNGTVLWSPSVGLSSTTSLNPIANPSATTLYTLKVTGANGCSDTSKSWVYVNPLPVSNFSAPTVCLNDTTIFSNTTSISSGSIAQYNWLFGGTGGLTSNLFNPTIIYDTCGTFQITLVSRSDKGCIGVVVKPITIQCLPIIKYTISDSILCEATKVSIQNSTTFANSYHWSWGDSSYSTLSSPHHLYSASGQYVLTLVASNNVGCKDSLSKAIYVNDKPDAGFIPTDGCQKTLISFTDTSTIDNGFIQKWSWALDTVATSTSPNPTVIFPNSGSYDIKLIVTSNLGCRDTSIKTISIYSKPEIQINTSFGCLDVLNTISAQSSNGVPVTNWKWDLNNDGIMDSTGLNVTYSYTTQGQKTIKVIGTTPNGCTDTTQRIIDIYPSPIANFTTSNASACAPYCFTIIDSSYINSNTSFINQWIWKANDQIFATNQDTVQLCANQSNAFDISLEVISNNGCKSIAKVKDDFITAYPKPHAEFDYSPSNISLTDSYVGFYNYSTNSDLYEWNFGDTKNNLSKEFNPSHLYTDTGKYCITLKAYTSFACFDSSVKCIDISTGFAVYIPNAFTPNADKKNELFKPIGFGFYEKDGYEFLIFNRWGELIFRSNEYHLGWDGTAKTSAELVQEDVYVYKLKVKEITTDETHKYVGTVTLLK